MAAGITILEMSRPVQPSLEAQSMLRHDTLPRESLIGLHSRSRCKARLSPRKHSDYLLEGPIPHPIIKASRSRDQLRQASQSSYANAALAFTIFTTPPHAHAGFVFSEHHPASFRGTKRHRLGSDIDGPNTLELSRKKRRLRSHLVTSRLSRPFSQPATHILHRQGRERGDRRLRKMATTIDLSRRATRLQATSFLRFSVMNCIRRRLGLARRTDDQERGHSPIDVDRDTSAKAPWQQQQQQQQHHHHNHHHHQRHHSAKPYALVPAAVVPLESTPKAPSCRLSNPVALPLPSADKPVTINRISSRIYPTPSSPEPRQQPLGHTYEDYEDDAFAFPHLEVEHTADDDLEHVYCDFDAIFGAKASSPKPEPQSAEDHTYEEYMDELDGISWRIR